MSNIYFFSGPCGCGKSTLAKTYAKHLVNNCGRKQVYLIHGDDFHAGFIEADDKGDFFVNGQAADVLLWNDILKLNWECMLSVARKVLEKDIDVVMDYVIEDELPLVRNLAEEFHATLYYVVLTATQETIKSRITNRGDIDMIERALFLKEKLDNLPENKGHLFDNTKKTPEQETEEINMEVFRVV